MMSSHRSSVYRRGAVMEIMQLEKEEEEEGEEW